MMGGVMEERAVCESEEQKEIRRRREYVLNVKYEFKMFLHSAFWRTLFFFIIVRPYSIAMCRLNLYRVFPDGRCMWCGKVH